MTDFDTAQHRLERAIEQLERALDAREDAQHSERSAAARHKANNAAIADRVDAAIERLQAILDE